MRKFSPDEFNLFRTWLKNIATMGLSQKAKESVIKVLEESSPEEVEKMIYNLTETLKEDVIFAREEGIEEGIEKGIEKGKLQVAKNMLAENTPLDFIVKVTGLSIDDIKKLQTENNARIH